MYCTISKLFIRPSETVLKTQHFVSTNMDIRFPVGILPMFMFQANRTAALVHRLLSKARDPDVREEVRNVTATEGCWKKNGFIFLNTPRADIWSCEGGSNST
jgi:hypothetical protein